MLTANGFDFTNLTFEFDNPTEITEIDIAQDTMLLTHLTFDKYDHFTAKYGITNAKAVQKTVQTPPADAPKTANHSEAENFETITTLSAQLDALYHTHQCGEAGGSNTTNQ
jgi:hypothetical protein